MTDPASADLATVAMTYKTLTAVCNTEMVPRQYRGKPDTALAAVLYGREMGLQPMQSLNMIDVIDGKPALSAELMNAMIRKAGHDITVNQYGPEAVQVTGTRADTGTETTVAFTIQEAKTAGLLDKKGSSWSRYPADMLWARAVSRLARIAFPDVLTIHAYTPQDLGQDSPPAVPSAVPFADVAVDVPPAGNTTPPEALPDATESPELIATDTDTGKPVSVAEAAAVWSRIEGEEPDDDAQLQVDA